MPFQRFPNIEHSLTEIKPKAIWNEAMMNEHVFKDAEGQIQQGAILHLLEETMF